MDIHIWYTVLSAVVGGVMGARARLGEVLYTSLQHLMGFVLWLCVDHAATNGCVHLLRERLVPLYHRSEIDWVISIC